MALITWEETYSVNIREIDDQHKKLFNLINILYDAMREGRDNDVLGRVLSELIDYTVYHFDAEERLFQKHGYPEYKHHKKEHDNLARQAVELRDKFNLDGYGMISLEVLIFLKDWLKNHVMVTDRKYASFLNGKGVV